MKKNFDLVEIVERAMIVKDVRKYLKQEFSLLRKRGASFQVCDKLAHMLQEKGINCLVHSDSVQDSEIIGVSKSGNIIRYSWNNYFLVVVYNEEIILYDFDSSDYSEEEAEEVFDENYEY